HDEDERDKQDGQQIPPDGELPDAVAFHNLTDSLEATRQAGYDECGQGGCEETNEHDQARELRDDKGRSPREPTDTKGEDKKDAELTTGGPRGVHGTVEF